MTENCITNETLSLKLEVRLNKVENVNGKKLSRLKKEIYKYNWMPFKDQNYNFTVELTLYFQKS